jgi:hypothetical protein
MSDLTLHTGEDGSLVAIRPCEVASLKGTTPGRKSKTTVTLRSGVEVLVIHDVREVAEDLGLSVWQRDKGTKS